MNKEKVVTYKPTSIFNAKEEEKIEGDLEVLMYEDGSIMFSGMSILETRQFTELLNKIREYNIGLKARMEKEERE